MRLLKSNVLLRLLNSYLVDSPQPANISYLWNFGSLLGFCLILQILTGVFLAMHYTPNVDMAFSSVEHIMRDVSAGWALRYTHANVASFFFIFVYFHIARGLYYSSYREPRSLVWNIGVIIFILMMAIGFLGYVLPYGQMSLWGATVITNLLSAIPVFGKDLVELIWGGFSVSNATLNRFFSLHFVLPFLLVALVVGHFILLHEHGSGNPNGITGNGDRYPMHPYFSFKDLVTVFLFLLALSIIVCFYPNLLGHSDNYVPANPMQTPASIVPEWYLLPFYAILRSIPNKLLGVLAMFGSLLILLVLPFTDFSRVRGSQFRPMMKLANWAFFINFLTLMWIGSEHPESPFVEIGQISTAFYFLWFLFIIPGIGLIENTLFDLNYENNMNSKNLISKKDQNLKIGRNTLTKYLNKKHSKIYSLSIIAVLGFSFLFSTSLIEGDILGLILCFIFSFLITIYIINICNFFFNIHDKFLHKLVIYSVMFILIFVILILTSDTIHCAGLEDSKNLKDAVTNEDQYNLVVSKGVVDNGIQAGKEVLKAVLSEGITSLGASGAAGVAAGATIKSTVGMPPVQRAIALGGSTFITAASTTLGIKLGKSVISNLDINKNIPENNNPDIDSIPSPTDGFISSPLELGDISPLEEILINIFKLNILLSILFFMFVFLIFYKYLSTANADFLFKLFNKIIPDRFKPWFNFVFKIRSNLNEKFILFLFILNIFNLIILLSINLYISFELATNIKEYISAYNHIHGISKF
uniref:Cytochrome b n=1 Tax=Mutinus fleischeri TaxID=2218478 RepID=A0A8K1RCE9_9AGAM|nr:apocytochrome b [Mutinus fleischeri]